MAFIAFVDPSPLGCTIPTCTRFSWQACIRAVSGMKHYQCHPVGLPGTCALDVNDGCSPGEALSEHDNNLHPLNTGYHMRYPILFRLHFLRYPRATIGQGNHPRAWWSPAESPPAELLP